MPEKLAHIVGDFSDRHRLERRASCEWLQRPARPTWSSRITIEQEDLCVG